VHLDLKPQNILFTDDGRVKVADFGIARALDEGARPEETLGTVPYAAPERARGGEVQPVMDVYSLGAVLYECMTGQPAFAGETAREVLAAQSSQRPASPRSINPDVPSALEFIAMKALHREPSRRYRSMAELQYDLGRVQGGEALHQTGILPREGELRELTQVTEEPLDEPGEPGPLERERTHPLLVWGARLLAVVIALGFAFAMYKVVRGLFFPESIDPSVALPSVMGEPLAEAEQTLAQAWLETGKVDYREDKDYQPGCVIEQSPSPDERDRVPKGTIVDLVVAKDVEEVVVVAVTGMPESEATARIIAAGLTVGQVTRKHDSEVEKGRVMEQTPAPPARRPRGEYVDLVVSDGPAPEPPVVPPPDMPPGVLDASDEGLANEHDPNVTIAPVPRDDLDAGVRSFRADVRVRGEREQHIRLVKTDDEDVGGKDILDVTLLPGQSQTRTFTGKGSVTVQAFVDGEPFRQPWEF
jgi:serine/threonine-protein kinase